jgi:hypothetical protein
MEIDCITGAIVYNELTAEQKAQQKLDIAAHAEWQKAQDAKAIARQAVLDKLGLTENEAKALLG